MAITVYISWAARGLPREPERADRGLPREPERADRERDRVVPARDQDEVDSPFSADRRDQLLPSRPRSGLGRDTPVD
jgi:hypothetical protein